MSDEVVNVLAEALEAIEKGNLTPSECLERYPEHRDELRDLLYFAVTIKGTHLPAIDPEFRSAARSRIIQAVTVPKPRTLPETLLHIWNTYIWVSFTRRPVLSYAVVVALILIMASVGTVYASTSALPGDSLYSVKTSVEDARLWFTSDDQQVELYLQFTNERIREIKALMEGGRYENIPQAVERFENQVKEATDKEPEESRNGPRLVSVKMEAFSNHKDALNNLMITAPDQAKPALAHAIAVSDQAQHKLSDNLARSTPEIPPTQTETPASAPAVLTPTLPSAPLELPTRTPTSTQTATPTSTPSRTSQPTRTATPTATPSQTPEPTGTPTPTESPSQTPSSTAIPSQTPQPTQTVTPSVTLTVLPTATETATSIPPTNTPTPSPTSTTVNPEACNGVLGAITVVSLRVPPGATCTLDETIVEGNAVVEESGALIAYSARIAGNLDAQKSARVDLLSGTEVNGNIQIVLSGPVRIVSIYAGRNLTLEGNSQGHEISANWIIGNVDIVQNTGGVSIWNNTINGNLACTGNIPLPTGGNNNVAGNATGQCALLR
jgi:hypothetical protein